MEMECPWLSVWLRRQEVAGRKSGRRGGGEEEEGGGHLSSGLGFMRF